MHEEFNSFFPSCKIFSKEFTVTILLIILIGESRTLEQFHKPLAETD